MKIRTLTAFTVITAAASFAVSAETQDIQFKPVNQTLETQVCVTAATEGLSAARKLVLENDINFRTYSKSVTCNGESITEFANLYFESESKSSDVIEQRVVAVRAKNNDVESQLCLDALIIGEEQARQKHDLNGVPVMCNNKPLSIFVRNFEKQNVTVTLAD